jgi:hypothetical protein
LKIQMLVILMFIKNLVKLKLFLYSNIIEEYLEVILYSISTIIKFSNVNQKLYVFIVEQTQQILIPHFLVKTIFRL